MQVAWAQSVCATPGKDGSTFTASPNTYYPGVGTAAANTTSVTVGSIRTGTGASATTIGAGDLLLIIQMQGADINSTNSDSYGDGVAGSGASGYLTSNLTAGQYEYAAVSSVSGTTITLSAGLKNSYVTSAVNGTATLRTFQVVRVPQYTNLALTANIVPPFWDGSTGGITALDVQGQLNFGTAIINAAGLGFRGGAGIKQGYNAANTVTQYVTGGPANLTAATTNLNAQKGEGIAGTPRFVNVLGATTATNTGIEGYPGGTSSRGAPGNAGGGGNDNGNNSGGGGGGNAGPGGRGGLTASNNAYGGEPGATFASSPSVLIMGGGGGAGTTNDGSGNAALDGFASSGAPGGGIVLVRTGTVSGSGGIVVDGADAPAGVRNDGAGGGGAGGSILLTAASSQAGLANLTLSAKGGAGGIVRPVDAGNNSTAHGPGGGGGGGVVFSSGTTQNTLAASTTGGAAGTSTPGTGGTTTSPTSTYGAANGSNATAANGSTSTSNTIANSSAGATCAPIVLTVPAGCANAGKDGATFSATPNTYYPGVNTAAANATSLTVGSIRTGAGAGATAIGVGDLLLVIQMQGADINNANTASYGSTSNVTAGQYEYVVVSAVSGTTVTFTTGLKNTYVTSAANAVPIRTFQVVRVPQYSSLTLTANIVPAAWNGSTGGLVALDVAGAINLNGNTINVSGVGFRGGAGRVLTTNNFDDTSYLTTSASGFNGQKGEGLAGTPQYVNNGGTIVNTTVDGYLGGSASRGAPGNAGGGGNDNNNNSGGGGGANGGAGGRGGNNFINNNAIGGEPGATFAATGTSLVLGGGGGAGSTNNGTGGGSSAGIASSGSAGGGIVIVRAGSVAGTGSVLANAAATLTGVANDGGGGGGAGGSILITAVTPSGLSGLTLSANGAAGGNTNPASVTQSQHGPGGGGGGGIIFTNGAVASATATGGATGQTTYTAANNTTATAPYGAAAGATGVINTNTSLASTGGTSGANCTSVTGTIFDDSNYGGGTGRSLSAAASSASGLSIGSAGTTVELYNSTGSLVATTTTAANGSYSFSGLTAGAGYVVRVVNSTVKSARTPGATGLVPVQTFRTTASAGLGAATSDGNRVGGEAPEKQDAAANSGTQTLAALTAGTATPQSITSIAAGTTGVDFGYNYDVVVNTNDAGQGSLRQFILNANALGNETNLAQAGSYTNPTNLATGSTAAGLAATALPAGVETSIFMIPAARLTSGVAVITPASALPQITGANTGINGATQTFNIGNTNDVLLGTGGTVGTQATALSRLNGPEVQLVGNTGVAFGLDVNASATNTRIRGLSIYGFGNAPDNDGGGNIRSAANSLVVSQNVLGTTAASFTAPATPTNADNVRLIGGTSGVSVTGNLIGYSNSKGVSIDGLVTNVSITGNEVRNNGLNGTNFDGIDINGSSATVTGNLLTGTSGQGVDSYRSTGSNVITGNTIANNGRGTTTIAPSETPGARIYGANNTVSQNIIANNYGAGIMLEGVNGNPTAVSNTVMSQNSIYGNGTVTARNGAAATGEVGIDLQANGDSEVAGTSPFVTLNSATTTGANGLLNYPVITSATISGTNLVVNGYAKAGAAIELFTAQPNPTGTNSSATVLASNFGQGRTYLTTVTEGTSDTDARTGLSYSGPINGFNQGSDTNANGFSFTIPLSSLPGGVLPVGTVLTSTATLSGATSEFSGNATVTNALTGYVFEDVNYGGGAGRPRTAGGAVVRSGARVELYDASGTFVSATTTDATGQYTFNVPAATYTVRVVNSTVSSSRTGYVAGLLPVQTYNGTTTAVGGVNPAKTDAGNGATGTTLASLNTGTTIAASQANITLDTGTTSGPDFGYNFDVVVNTNDAGQGSLRQFITNASALSGENLLTQSGSNAAGTLPTGTETSIFMIPDGLAHAGLLASSNGGPASQLNASGVAVISPTSVLPTITGANTSLDATTQTFNIGNTNAGTLGAGGTVGTAATALLTVNRPEVQLVGNRNNDGVIVAGNNSIVRGLSLYGFSHDITVNTDITAFLIEQNVVGTSATSFTDPGAGVRTLNEGILLSNADNGTVRNNLVGYNGGMGVWVLGSGNGANGNTISGNEIRGNAQESKPAPEGLVFDGLELQGASTGNTVSGNLITGNYGNGIDSFGNTIGGNTVSGNTISNNGVGVATNTGEEGSGLRVFGATNPTIITGNVLSGNNGSGVLVIGSANQVTISQNSTSGNTRLGIDLISETNAPVFYNGNTGTTSNVTLNDSGDGDTGGNGLLNFPVLTTATVSGTSLVVNGYARPGSIVELFLATPLTTDPTNSNKNFGQGSSFLATRTEGNTTDDSNTGTGTYGAANAAINGVYQGTDNTNQFTFTIPLASLTAAQRTALLNGSAVLTSTGTLTNSTSEFSGNLPVPVADVTVALTGPATVSPGVPTGTYTATFTNEGPGAATGVTRTVTLPANATNVVLPAGATLTGSVIDFGTAATLATGASNAFSFSFTPATTATGSVAITANVASATSQGVNTAPDASTINATVVPVANVATTITAVPTALAAGTPAGTGGNRFNVTFSNNGPNAAAGVVASVQLPTGLTNVSSTNNTGGVYSPATGILTFPGITSLAGNGAGNVSSAITFDVPTTNPASVGTAAGALVASARIATTTNEAGQTADNTASATLNVTPAYDLLTTISGPTQAVAGNPVTLAVTTTNNGLSATTGVVQTVQLVSGLSNVYVSNGGVYNPATTTQTLTVNGVSYSVPAGAVVFPTIVGMPSGQTVANSITYSQPTTAFAPSATVTPNAAGSATTAGDTNPANNTAYLNGNASATNITTASSQPGTANAYTTITTSAASTTLGSPVTLTVTTGNNGPNQATGTTQLVQLVPGFDVTTLKINGTTGTLSNNVITFATGLTYNVLTGLVTFPALTDGANGSASGTSVSNTITLTPTAATAGRNGRLLPVATVQTSNTDPVPADNVASVGVTLAQSADLATTITGPATAVAGQLVTYTVSFTNNGPTIANNVAETAQIPAGLSGGTITDAAGNAVSGANYNSTTGLVTFPTITNNPSGATQVFKLTFAAPNQSFTPGSNISSPNADAVSTNNSASTSTTVTATADLVTTVAGPPTAVVGNAVTYTVNTTNNGPAPATNTATTLKLAAGFSPATLQVGGVTGTQSGNTITYTLPSGATATYDTGTGLVTFPTVATLASGASAANYVTFVMPNAAGGQTTGVASTSATQADPTPTNNTASVATSVAPTTTTSADVTALVSVGSATATAGSNVVFTASYANSGPDAATNVVPTLQLQPGLTTTTLSLAGATSSVSGSTISFSNGANYNQTTGLLTFATIASQASGAAATTYTATVVAPANGLVVATAATTSATSEPATAAAQANDVQSASATVTPLFDAVTALAGPASAPAGTTVTYTVTTTNNGPSLTANATTQTVILPAGVTPITGSISNGGTFSGNTITWIIPAGQGAGGAGAVANTFSVNQTATGVAPTANVSLTGESSTTNNVAYLNGATSSTATTVTNLTPLAYAVVNTLQNPQSNDGGGLANGLLISPLNASDPENSFATLKYTIASIPTNAGANNQGTLYYNDGTANGAYSAVAAGQTLTDAQAKTLRFKAAAGFVGNASFTYTTTDAAGNTSLAANYTIPVESDTEAVAYTLTPVKGGSSGAYVANDVIAFATDTNGAVYNAATAKVYQDNGQLQAGSTTTGGIVAATAGTFTSSNPAVTSLSGLGLAVQPDGRLVVSDPNALRSGSYSVQVTTIDANGGTTTQVVSFVIPINPLPVVLTTFDAKAMQNRDALLSWTTASEINAAHFDIERSFDGTTFAKIGQVAARGTSASAGIYAFTDAGVAAKATGPVYYRLRQVDLDGTATYSPQRTVSFTMAAKVSLSVYPNPVASTTTLNLEQLSATSTYQGLLLDATGRQVRTWTLAGGQAQLLDLTGLASGSYLLVVTGTQPDGSLLKQTLRLTKE